MINFTNTAIRRNNEIVLRNINWQIAPNENWIITGPTGSGKSTLLESILRKHFASEGSITHTIFKDRFREYIALVPSDYSFNQFLSQNAQYYQQRYNAFDDEAIATTKEILMTIADEKSVEEVAKVLNISHLLERKIIKLSTGETRRTLIAVAMLRKPDVLLLDNPFGGLDVASRKLLHEALKNIIKSGKQVIMATNEMDDSFGYFDKVLVLEKGRVTKITSPQTPLQSGEGLNLKLAGVQSELFNPEFSSKGNPFKTAIKFKDVSVRYGEDEILKNINWAIKQGEKWALLGPNGSGKSTLLSLMYADNPQAYAHNITLFDKRRGTGETIWDIKRRMGFLSSEFHLHYKEHLPCFEVIATGFFDTVGLHKVLNQAQLEQIDRFLKLFDIEHIKQKYFRTVSFGEQRLVLLARALIKNPEFLILDEPTQSLDYTFKDKVKQILDVIYTNTDTTIIYVTHTTEDIPTCINKKIFLGNGAIVRP